MAKTKISEKRGASQAEVKYIELNGILYQEDDSLAWLLDEDNILAALAECVEEKDLKGALGVIRSYQYACKMARRLEREASQAKSTPKKVRELSDSKRLSSAIGLKVQSRSKE